MKDFEYKKGIERIKNLKMTAEEKRAVFERVFKSEPVISPWTVFSFVAWFKENRWAYAAVTFAAVILLVSGGTINASRGALPGDLLYSIKVSVKEPVQELLAFSNKAKASLAAEFATARLEEAETLAVQGRLDIEKLKMAQESFVAKVNAFDETVTPPEAEVRQDFDAALEAHSHILSAIENSRTDDEVKFNGLEEAVKEKIATRKTKPVVSATMMNTTGAEPSVQRTQSLMKDTEEVKVETAGTSTEREAKKKIRRSIDETRSSLFEEAATTTAIWNNEVINEAHSTLDAAEQSLKDANDKEESGDGEAAKEALKKSRKATREARVLLDTGLKLKKKEEESRKEREKKSEESRKEREENSRESEKN